MTLERQNVSGGGAVMTTECPFCGAKKEEWHQQKLPYHLLRCPEK